ncbi:oxidoreductase-like protein [Podospora fimiseda]|uniref:Oxidoreductase-like protein n=1 Tax=Podospora fimiseda TaxID=252190 RepID=A0AAN7GU00_9PEZI|nr:oxidoreductase-like protein [Podospora fimiseda]
MTGIALLGAGIFAKQEHLPAILATPKFTLLAIYSRSRTTAESLLASLPSSLTQNISIYYSSPPTEGKSLEDLLARSDIQAVDIALPILHQPAVIEQCIKAGKHVLSEKPVAGDIVDAATLIGWYYGLGEGKKALWAVAENFRYMESLKFAGEKVKELGGKFLTFRLERYGYVEADNRYFKTEWRKVPSHQGGFLLDGGVHFIAGLRYLLGAAGQEIKQLAGFSGLLEERLVPVDTVHAVALTNEGRSGSIVLTFGTEFKNGLEVEIITTNGTVTWSPTGVKVVAKKADGNGKEETTKEFDWSSGVTPEVAAFAQAIEDGKVAPLQTPEEALKDLELLQRLLESGAAGAALKLIGA